MANELSLDNVGGIFVVLLAGMGIACSIAVIEYIWKSRILEKKINIHHSYLVKKAIDHCLIQVQIYGTSLD